MARDLHPALLHAAVQAVVPAGRPQGGHGDALAARGLADAVRRGGGGLAARGREPVKTGYFPGSPCEGLLFLRIFGC